MAPATDRLSLLPESLILTILCLMPIKDAVRTSALSRAWRHTWRSIPIIQIDESHFPSLEICLIFTLEWLLNYPQPTIDRFSMIILSPPEFEIRELMEWCIGFALNHETKSLELDVAGPPINLPRFVYDYDGFDVLALFACEFTISEFANLSWLRTASLGRMGLTNAALRDLLRGCPLLESLILVECGGDFEYTVLSPTLENLVVDSCGDLLHLTVIAPKLKRFKYVGDLIGFGMTNAGVIYEADLDLRCTPYCVCDGESGDLVQRLLLNFCTAKVLKVCSYILQVVSTVSNPWQLPKLFMAKHLTLRTGLHHLEYVGIACLVTSCASLEKLELDVGPQHLFEDEVSHPFADLDAKTFWGEYWKAPFSVRNKLQEVEINGFGGSDDEIRFLKFLIEFGGSLRTIRLKVARDDAGAWVQLSDDMPRMMSTWPCKSTRTLNIVIE